MKNERFPDGCDWHKPQGCTCNFLAQAQRCENRCDDWLLERPRRSLNFAYGFAFLVFMALAGWYAGGAHWGPMP
jgi:hypothetical protein